MTLTDNPRAGRLLRVLGLGFGIAVIIGSTVGVGILRAPGEVTARMGSAGGSLAVWIVAGLYALLGTLVIAELGVALPRAGGWYVYARRAFGDAAGFVIGWTSWLGYAAINAALAVAGGEFAAALWPALAGHAGAAGVGLLLAFTAIQLAGTRSGKWTQEITSAAKALAFLALVAACFLLPARETVASAVPPLSPPTGFLAWFAAFIIALQFVIFAYDGWYSAVFFAEEDVDPAHNLPRAMLLGTLAVIAIYLLLNLAFFHVLGVAATASADVAAAQAADAVFGHRGEVVILVLSLLSVLGVLNACLLMAARILFGMARDRLLPGGLAAVSPGGTPVPALWVSTIAGLLFAATGAFDFLIAITAFFMVVYYLSGFLAVLVLRRREPDLPWSFRAPGQPFVTWLLIGASLAFLAGTLYSDTRNSLIALGLVAVSLPVFHVWRRFL